MSEKPSHGGATAQGPALESFGLFLAISFGGNAVAMAALLALAAVILDVPARRLWVPYAALLVPGLVLAPYLYWGRLTRDRPRACAIRFTTGFFSYLIALSMALLFGAVWIGALSPATAMYEVAPPLLPLYILLAVPFYFFVARLLADMQRAHQANAK